MTVESSLFIGCGSFGQESSGGAISISYKIQIEKSIKVSHFISNYANHGGAISIYRSDDDEHWNQNASLITIVNSTFSNNRADDELYMGGTITMDVNNQSIIIFQNVFMESNRGVTVKITSSIKILQVLLKYSSLDS